MENAFSKITLPDFKKMKREPERLEVLAMELQELIGKQAWSVVRNPKYPEGKLRQAMDAYRKNQKGVAYFFGILKRL